METIKMIGIGIFLVLYGLLVLSLLYFLIAGIWSYNPYEIAWFNTKGMGTSLILIIVFAAILKIGDEI